jgi:hypothetical protein
MGTTSKTMKVRGGSAISWIQSQRRSCVLVKRTKCQSLRAAPLGVYTKSSYYFLQWCLAQKVTDIVSIHVFPRFFVLVFEWEVSKILKRPVWPNSVITIEHNILPIWKIREISLAKMVVPE